MKNTRPPPIEWFGEVAAVYHAAKAISISNDYPKIVTTFVEAVSQDGGHPFLFSILLNPKSERETIPEAPPSKIVITDIEKIGGSGRIKARFDKGGTGGGEATGVDPPPSDPPPSDPPSTETAEDADADADPTAGTFEGSDTPTVTTQTRDAMLAVLEMVDAGADPSAIHEFLREAAEEDASLNPYTGAAFVDMDPENWRAIAQPILDAESLDVDEGLDFAPEDFGGD